MEPEPKEDEEESDYDASPEMETLAEGLIKAVESKDAAAVAKAFRAMCDEHAGAEDSEPSAKEHKPSLAILLGKGH